LETFLMNSTKTIKFGEGERYLWLFSFFTIAINLLTGTYTNGVTWSYYFIPSFFAIAAIYLVLLLRIYRLWNDQIDKKASRLTSISVSTLIALVLFQILPQPLESVFRYQVRQVDLKEVKMMASQDFMIDEALPSSFTYISHYINNIPVKAHHWGYHFMLTDNQGFWRDCYQLGLGPDPQKVWGHGFGKNPPDALAFSDPTDVVQFISMLWYCHNINVSWLIDEIKKHYIPVRYKWLFLYARRDKVQYLKQRGWRVDLSKKSVPFDGIFEPYAR